MAVLPKRHRHSRSGGGAAALWAYTMLMACAEAGQAPLSPEGQLNVYGPADLALVSEFTISDAKLATFKTACYNPTIAGYGHVTAAAKAAAASALGITVKAWPAHRRPTYDNAHNRTTFSAAAYWGPCHAEHISEFQQNGLEPKDSQWPFIMYGDSLTELWEGSRGCVPYPPREGFVALRQRYLGPAARAVGMSGETGANTLWRVHNGEAVGAAACPKLFQVYTGTNDLPSSVSDAGPYCMPAYAPLVAHRTIQIVEALRGTCPDAQFILRGLGPKTSDPDSVWPNVYTVANQHFNYLMKAYADANPNVNYLVCGWSAGAQGYLRESTVEDLPAECRADEACVGAASALAPLRVDRTMLGDGTHPTEAGVEIQGRCMAPIVEKVLGWNSVSGTFVPPSAQPALRPTPEPVAAPTLEQPPPTSAGFAPPPPSFSAATDSFSAAAAPRPAPPPSDPPAATSSAVTVSQLRMASRS